MEGFVRLIENLPLGGYEQNVFVHGAFVLALFVLVGLALLFVYSHYLQRLAKKTKTEFDDMILNHTKKPFFYLILAYGLKVAVLTTGITGTASNVVNSIMAAVFALIILRAIDVIIETWGLTMAKKTKTNIDDVLLPLFHKMVNVIFVIVALLWILKIWGIDIGPYLAGVGISGIVLGLALQDSLKNILGGITLILDKTFQPGDKIKLESGEVGIIHEIGLRSTKLTTFDNEIIYIPNGYLANSRIQNYTRPNPKVRVVVPFGVEYGTELTAVKEVILKELKAMDIMEDPEPLVHFVEMGDSALTFEAKFWVKRWDEAYGPKLEATERIYNALNKANIGIPFPTRTVYMNNTK
jgi:MscS family membrane protein